MLSSLCLIYSLMLLMAWESRRCCLAHIWHTSFSIRAVQKLTNSDNIHAIFGSLSPCQGTRVPNRDAWALSQNQNQNGVRNFKKAVRQKTLTNNDCFFNWTTQHSGLIGCIHINIADPPLLLFPQFCLANVHPPPYSTLSQDIYKPGRVWQACTSSETHQANHCIVWKFCSTLHYEESATWSILHLLVSLWLRGERIQRVILPTQTAILLSWPPDTDCCDIIGIQSHALLMTGGATFLSHHSGLGTLIPGRVPSKKMKT